MKIRIATLFPEMFDCLKSGILGRAQENGLLEIDAFDVREFSQDKHKKCDDYPFGGGAGMVMTPQPLHDAITAADPDRSCRRIFMSPRGRTLSQSVVEELAAEDKLLFVCGDYEGIDQRVVDMDVDEELSIGDYILTGGELAAMVVIDAVARYVEGVLGSEESTREESFGNGLLEYPQYTRPRVFCEREVPEVLLSGNHAEIDKWRMRESLEITRIRRPDLYREYVALHGEAPIRKRKKREEEEL